MTPMLMILLVLAMAATAYVLVRGEVSPMLLRIQTGLSARGADPAPPGRADGALRIVSSQVERLEREIDAINKKLAPLTTFTLPSAPAGVSALHLARATARRCE